MADTLTHVNTGPSPIVKSTLGKGLPVQYYSACSEFIRTDSTVLQTGVLVNGTKETTEENKENQTNGKHMVQNQMTPTYAYATQPGLEEYHQAVAAAQAATVTSEAAVPQTAYTSPAAVTVTNGAVEQQTVRARPFNQTELPVEGDVASAAAQQAASQANNTGPKRLHVSNIPFRFREADLRQLLGQFGAILDVEIIFNERGSKGFGFVTFANSADADRAREKMNGTVVEGRKIEVNNATARVMTKKAAAPNIPNAAALRGVALTRGRAAAAVAARGAAAYSAVAAATAFRHPTPLAATATALPYAVYQDPFLATYDAAARYQTVLSSYGVTSQGRTMGIPEMLVTSQPYAAAAGYAGAARYAIPTVATAGAYAAAAQSVYGREFAADPYLGSIGPVAGYPATVYRGGYQRFAPY